MARAASTAQAVALRARVISVNTVGKWRGRFVLFGTAGLRNLGTWGGPVEEIRPGDVIWFPPGEKHQHGASPTTAMTHIAIAEQLDGKSADWMEKVSDEQYEGA
jgi:hypothetical protein